MAKSKARRKSLKNAKRWKTAEELRALLAERSGVPAHRVAIYGQREYWGAVLIVNQVGNAGQKAKFKTLVLDAQREFDLRDE